MWRQTYADEVKAPAYEEEWMEQFLAWLLNRVPEDLGDLVGEFALDHGLSSGETDQLEREMRELVDREDW